MQFNQINYFLRACDTLNFTQAAEICGISQPTLSTAINKLEEELGGALFSRLGRSMVLTPLGTAMRLNLGLVENAKNAANKIAHEILNSQNDLIDIGLMCTLSPERLLASIVAFAGEHAQVELLIHDVGEKSAQELLLAGALECVIMAYTDRLNDKFVEYPLIEEPMVLAMNKSHSLFTKRTVQLSDLRGLAYVDRLRCEFRESFFREMTDRDIKVQTVMRTEREDLVQESISQGVGITVMPKSAAIHCGLQIREMEELNVVRTVGLVVIKGRELKPATQRFIQLTQAAYT